MTSATPAADTSSRKLTQARWTHVAIPSMDIDRSIDFYTSLTPLVLVARNQDPSGQSAWLSNANQVETPFVLVLVQLAAEVGAQFGIEAGKPHRTLGPFSHIGVELPHREDVDAVAAQARELGCLHWEPMQMAEHVGYVCAVTDPDGNVIEFSHNQKVFETIRNLWGAKETASA
ncbi:MAG TPA: VOC family protein [Candidatus Dormibacteraeota bacterium]